MGREERIRARAFVTLLKGYGVALVGLGDVSRVEAREPTLREIFATFDFKEGPKDPGLVGSWRYESVYMSGDFSSTSVRYMTLRADGTFGWGSRLLFSSDAGGGDTGGSPGERGRWSAANKKLSLVWDDGSYAEYGYYVQGAQGSRQMLLKPTNGDKNQLWEEVQ